MKKIIMVIVAVAALSLNASTKQKGGMKISRLNVKPSVAIQDHTGWD